MSDGCIDGQQVKDIAPKVVALVNKWDLHKKQRETSRYPMLRMGQQAPVIVHHMIILGTNILVKLVRDGMLFGPS
jgi:hypothetical protein